MTNSSLKEIIVTRICHSMTDTNQTIMDMYLACYSQEEIAAAVDVDKGTINRKIESLLQNGNLAKMQQTHTNQTIMGATLHP